MAIHLALEHAAANGERAGGRVHGHAAYVLGDLAADEAQHALAERGHHLARVLGGVVNEFVDDEVGAWTHGEGRAVDEQHLHQPLAGGVDALIEEDGVADLHLGAVGEGVGLHGSRRADLVGKREGGGA